MSAWKRNSRSYLLAAAALVALVAAGTASSRIELRPQSIVTITATGFSPQVLRVDVGDVVPIWNNADTVSHKVTFGTGAGSCAVTIAPGAQSFGGCGLPACAGHTPFSVSGFEATTGDVAAAADFREVTLQASSKRIRPGQAVTLSGTTSYLNPSPPSPFASQPVLVRRVTSTGSRVIARVRSTGGWTSTWRIKLRPKATATYQVEVAVQPRPGCTKWIPAKSHAVTVVVR